jgi:catechol 2,3-dioxygenase-like lactoylglutathione lyase family enzyme
VLRLAHLDVRTPDLELSTACYTEVLGLSVSHRDEDAIYLKYRARGRPGTSSTPSAIEAEIVDRLGEPSVRRLRKTLLQVLDRRADSTGPGSAGP